MSSKTLPVDWQKSEFKMRIATGNLSKKITFSNKSKGLVPWSAYDELGYIE